MKDTFADHGKAMTNIIIVGYPKSGNTWVTRLVADLIGCPVVGFWGSDHYEIAQEGLHRKSEFRCYKSHHQLSELSNDKTPDKKKIIYVIRDPRDIIISGAHYFNLIRWPFLARVLSKFPKGRGFYHKVINPLIITSAYRIDRMMDAVLFGANHINEWVRISWKIHCKPYLESNCFFVKYEDLLTAPERECKRILNYLGLYRPDDRIKKTIEKQSFAKKKELFLANNDIYNAKFMRSGKSGQWQQKLTAKQKKMIRRILYNELKQLDYIVDEDIIVS